MQRVPYEGVSRMQTSLRRKHRDRVVRRCERASKPPGRPVAPHAHTDNSPCRCAVVWLSSSSRTSMRRTPAVSTSPTNLPRSGIAFRRCAQWLSHSLLGTCAHLVAHVRRPATSTRFTLTSRRPTMISITIAPRTCATMVQLQTHTQPSRVLLSDACPSLATRRRPKRNIKTAMNHEIMLYGERRP